MLGAEHYHRSAGEIANIIAAALAHRPGNGRQQAEAANAGIVEDVVRPFTGQHGHDAVLAGKALLHVQRLPGVRLLVLGEAVAVLGRRPVGR